MRAIYTKTVPNRTNGMVCLLVRFGGKKPRKPYQTIPTILDSWYLVRSWCGGVLVFY